MNAPTERRPVASGPPRHLREILTPEGVPIRLEVAPLGSRIAAQMIDQAIVWFGVIAISIATALLAGSGFVAGGGAAGAWILAFGTIGSWLWFNGYFVGTELLWAGQTVGKRQLGIRVVSRDGQPLGSEGLIARNLTRNIETLLPLAVLVNPQAVLPGAPVWAGLFGVLWLLVLAFLPLANRDHLRVGDMIGGTLVVTKPKTQLLADLTDEEVIRWGRTVQLTQEVPFTPEQLAIYGVHELQTLENVLRDYRNIDTDLVQRVAGTIKQKIDWDDGDRTIDDEQFLLAFYKAQRAHLEHRMLFGHRRASKFDRS